MYGVRCCAVRPSLKCQTSVYEAARHGTQKHSITVFLCVCVVIFIRPLRFRFLEGREKIRTRTQEGSVNHTPVVSTVRAR
jgi:hypothetical protein